VIFTELKLPKVVRINLSKVAQLNKCTFLANILDVEELKDGTTILCPPKFSPLLVGQGSRETLLS
jgi:hypothetical protein